MTFQPLFDILLIDNQKEHILKNITFEKVAHRTQIKRAKKLDQMFNQNNVLFGEWNKLQKAMFIAQLAHETGRFVYMHELGGRKYLSYLEGRKDLGNTIPGDGIKYKGRGLIMITGKFNYAKYSDKTGFDLLNYPELAEDLNVAMLVAMHYWKDRNIKKCEDDIRCATRKVNGGYNGLSDRTVLFNKLLDI